MAEIEHLVFCGNVAAQRRRKRSDHILELNLDGSEPSVFLEILGIERRLVSDVPDPVIDLVEIATYVYCADQAISRGGEGVLATGGGWRRRFVIHVPVRRPDIWSSQEVCEVLQKTVCFLSDDEYEFRFEQRTVAKTLQPYLKLSERHSETKAIEEVLLFSGGLDSLAGAVREGVWKTGELHLSAIAPIRRSPVDRRNSSRD